MATIFNSTSDINAYVSMAQKAGPGVINPETFYSKQLLDTIRYDADQYVYHKLADEAPIQEKADKLMVRRWAPLQAHTVPLTEGVPPKSDKGSVEKYEMSAHQYGRYMEFTDKVDFKVVDPVIAHYTKEYALVALETLDLLARETLFSIAQKRYAGDAANFEELTLESKPTLTDLRLIVLDLKKSLVKPRANGAYHVIGSPEFYFDMISDPVVEKYMTINNKTETMYANTKLVKMFDLEFYETLIVPTSGEFTKDGTKYKRFYKIEDNGNVTYQSVAVKTTAGQTGYYAIDSRTGAESSYIPYANGVKEEYTAPAGFNEFKAQHILVVGKDALTRTGLAGEGQAKMYVKQKGSSGVLDPIDQRQSIGFKINSVGYGCTRLEAVHDYICVPTEVNI